MQGGSRPAHVLILGGGPAGSAAGRLLALLGHGVRILARPNQDRSRLAESLPPSTRKLFDVLGVAAAIDAAGFLRSTGNTAWWGGPEARVELFADDACGWQVDAASLERVLQEQAVLAGAVIDHQAFTAADLEHPPRAARDGEAFILDCTGRAGLLARANSVRRYKEAPRTVALAAAWRRDDRWPVPDDTHTLIESYADGWAWSVPLASGERHIAVMVDPQRSALARGAPARKVYLAELAKTRMLGALARTGRLDAGPWGWDATTYGADRYAGDHWLLVGDAGSTIDPLSSVGVKKALASGWLAAIVVHTCLRRPEMRETALHFFDAREREIHAAYQDLARRHLSAAAGGHPWPFWADRSNPAEDIRLTAFAKAPASPPKRSARRRKPDATRDDVAVRKAFEQIRKAPRLSVRRGMHLRIEPRPAVSGFEIVLEQRLVTDDHPEGVRYLLDVDALTLVELAPSVSQVPDLFEAYCRRSAPVALPDFLRVLATALARGWLVA